MAYRRPGVTVTQQFVGLTPALAQFSLPSVAVGPAYQLVTGDSLGNYTGLQTTYAYASLLGGAIVDAAMPVANDPVAGTKLPTSVTLKNTFVQVLPTALTGVGAGTAFSDPTVGQFANVAAGDQVVVTAATGDAIVPAQTNGITATANRNRLTAGVVGQFATVEVGDTVVATGAAPTTAGTYHVTAISGDTLILDGNINDGSAGSSTVAYSITGNRGATNAGTYTVATVTDANHLVLTSPLPLAESPLSYSIKRLVPATASSAAGVVTLNRLAAPGTTGFTSDANGVYLPANMTVTVGAAQMLVVSGTVFADYRALRTDLAANVQPFTSVADITAVFGLNQITPQNPLAFALEVMLQNTVTSVSGLGLDANAATNEVLSFTNATAVLGLVDMYAIAVLSQNPVVHQLMASHVTGESAPAVKLERVCLINSLLMTKSVLQASEATAMTVNNSRIVVNTQLDGSGVVASPNVLNDVAPSTEFHNVQPGDLVVVQAGTGVTPGQYTVLSHLSDTQLRLSANFITSGSPADIQYYIVRQDGLGADGVTFYDRNASFLADGVAAGHYLTISAPSAIAGRYKIGSVVSNSQLQLAVAIPGVATLQTAVTYTADRDLSKDEQATLVAGYSTSFANRRVVHCWPDLVQVPIGQTLEFVPGYYLGAAVAALTTGLPSQQGFTNLSVSGFLGLQHSSGYFSNTQLDTIAGGGTMVFAQDGPQQPLFVRHQLTSDMSAIKFQEYSITKNVDFIAKFTRNAFRGFPGRYNIVDTTKDELKATAGGVIKFLREDTRQNRIGGVIKSGSLTALTDDPTQIDTLKMRFQFGIPIPLNNLDITIEV